MVKQAQTELEQLGFTRIDTTVRRRLICSIEGEEGSGKTRWALTAPEPIVFFNLDCGDEGVADQFPDKEIYVVGREQGLFLPAPKAKNRQSDAKRAYERVFIPEYEKALESSLKPGGARSIIIDTATDLWALARVAEFGKEAQIMPHHYVSLNASFSELLNAGYEYGANLILLHKIKEEFETKKRERDGFKYMNNICQVMGRIEVVKGGDIELAVLKCRQNSQIHLERPRFTVYEGAHEDDEGNLVEGQTLYDFPQFAREVIRGSKLSEWR